MGLQDPCETRPLLGSGGRRMGGNLKIVCGDQIPHSYQFWPGCNTHKQGRHWVTNAMALDSIMIALVKLEWLSHIGPLSPPYIFIVLQLLESWMTWDCCQNKMSDTQADIAAGTTLSFCLFVKGFDPLFAHLILYSAAEYNTTILYHTGWHKVRDPGIRDPR